MWTRRCLITALLVSAISLLALACGGEDDRATPNCPNLDDCFTLTDGGAPVDGGAG